MKRRQITKKLNRAGFFLKAYMIIVIVVMILILVSFYIFAVNNIYQKIYDEAQVQAIDYTLLDGGKIDSSVIGCYNEMLTIQGQAAACKDKAALDSYFASIRDTGSFTSFRYYNGSTVYDISGNELAVAEDDELVNLRLEDDVGSTGLIFDQELGMKAVAYYCPVADNPNLTGIVGFYDATEMEQLLAQSENSVVSIVPVYHAVASQSGRIIYCSNKSVFPVDNSTNLFDYIRNITQSKSILDKMQKSIFKGENGAALIDIAEQKYVLTFCPNSVNASVFSVSVYNASDLFADNQEQITHLIITTFLICIVMFVLFLYILFLQRRYRKHLKEGVAVDNLLGCSTYNKFCSDAQELVNQNSNSRFSVVYLVIHRFRNLSTSFGPEGTDEVIRYLNRIISKTLTGKETYGHINDDQFVMILHYYNVQELFDRLKLLNALMFRCDVIHNNNYSVKLSCGAYCTERRCEVSVVEMVDCASIAQKSNESNAMEICTIYDENVRLKYLQEAEIEAKMEKALKDEMFVTFFQPKYDIAHDRAAGAESLVRWFDADTKKLIPPDSFIPLFESDGFIVRLDHYVFDKVCSFIAQTVKQGVKIIPISVNVSRVTAVDPNFADYYINLKRKYHIADHFIILEFTESFASDNYDLMQKIVNKLKNNGFLCSIDDFGSGYSSYGILKELAMDELKLDKFFIKAGVDTKKDDTLLRSMIHLAKELDMKVTQEGVETEEELNRLKNFGCDLAQGYYYSKPISQSDFSIFLESNTSMDAIRRFNASKQESH